MGRHLGRMVVAGSLWAACAGVACVAQTAPADTAPCTVAPQPVPCGAKAAQPSKPSTVDKFPFPEESSAPATSPAPNSDSAAPKAPDAPGVSADPGAAAKKKAATDFPFPDEDPKTAASSSSSSSSSSSTNDDDPNDTPDAAGVKDKGSEGEKTEGRHLLHRVNPPGTKLLSPEEREAEDLDVAHFYTQSGDLKGAYLRTQDAVKTAPDDPDAHFALAQAALKLGKTDEAIAEYTACLTLDPDDKQAKAARKELARLKPVAAAVDSVK